MWCTFDTFDARLFNYNAGIPYKYVIYSPKMEEKYDCFEFLHGHEKDGSGHVNRYIMPSLKKHQGENNNIIYM